MASICTEQNDVQAPSFLKFSAKAFEFSLQHSANHPILAPAYESYEHFISHKLTEETMYPTLKKNMLTGGTN